MKKKTNILMMLALTMTVAAGAAFMPNTVCAKEPSKTVSTYQKTKAIQFEDLNITELSSLRDYDLKVRLSWSHQWNLSDASEDTKEETYYGKFVLRKDSYVRIRMTREDYATLNSKDEISLYDNKELRNPLGTNTMGYGFGDDWYELKAGTYYMSMSSKLYYASASNHVTKMMIGAVPKSQGFIVNCDTNTSKTKTKITVKQNVDKNVQALYYKGKIVPNSVTTLSHMENNSLTVTDNGWYTIVIRKDSTVPFDKGVFFYKQICISDIDKKAPTVTGVKNGVTYKKTVTIKYEDTNSGIKSAILNGTKIKSGTKVSKNGTYKLVVTDKAGNVKTVNFKIKK